MKTVLALLLMSTNLAATPKARLVVDWEKDSNDGSCPGHCNLRAAVIEALKEDGSTIVLRVDSYIDQGAIVLAPSAKAAQGVRILSLTGQKKILGQGYSRLFEISEHAKVQLSQVRIEKFGAYDGGAIINRGELELEHTTLFDNKASCFGTGAMTAYATCSGGAIANDGVLVLKDGTRFEQNEVHASASTASYTTAFGYGGAISSSGTLVFDGSVVFDGNQTISSAASGVHPMPAGGAQANALGGAIHSFGGNLLAQQ